MITVLVIGTDLSVSEQQIPEVPIAQDVAVQTLVTERPGKRTVATAAQYHREALMWVADDGANAGLSPNVLATALASAWRGLDVARSYWLHGPVVVTGAHGRDAALGVPEERAADVRAALQAFADLRGTWQRTGAPADRGEQWRQVLGAVSAAVACPAVR